MTLAASDPIAVGQIAAAIAAVIAAALAYKKGRSADNRSIAVTELELAVRTLKEDNVSIRRELRDVRVELKLCTVDKRNLERRVRELEHGA